MCVAPRTGSSWPLYDRSYRALRGAALARLAALRVRQGRLAEAAELLADSEHDTAAVRPRVELHLARGEVDLAAERARCFLREHAEAELHGPLLYLLVRIELECGERPAAATTAMRLRDAADGQRAGLLHALAEHAAGLVAAVERSPDAVGHLEAALAGFGRLGLPLEEARARLDLAGVLVGERPAVGRPRRAAPSISSAGSAPRATPTLRRACCAASGCAGTSPPGSTSAAGPSSTTSPTSSPNSACPVAPRPAPTWPDTAGSSAVHVERDAEFIQRPGVVRAPLS